MDVGHPSWYLLKSPAWWHLKVTLMNNDPCMAFIIRKWNLSPLTPCFERINQLGCTCYGIARTALWKSPSMLKGCQKGESDTCRRRIVMGYLRYDCQGWGPSLLSDVVRWQWRKGVACPVSWFCCNVSQHFIERIMTILSGSRQLLHARGEHKSMLLPQQNTAEKPNYGFRPSSLIKITHGRIWNNFSHLLEQFVYDKSSVGCYAVIRGITQQMISNRCLCNFYCRPVYLKRLDGNWTATPLK